MSSKPPSPWLAAAQRGNASKPADVPPAPRVVPRAASAPASATSSRGVAQCEDPLSRGWPLGFDSKEQFETCMQELCDTLTSLEVECAFVGVRGTAATYHSHNPNKPDHYFDKNRKGAKRKSDVDVFFATDDHLIPRPSRNGQFYDKELAEAYEPISDWNAEWTNALGRKVAAAAFRTDADAMSQDQIRYNCRRA